MWLLQSIRYLLAAVRHAGLLLYWSIWITQDSTRELYKCYLRKTSYSIHQPSSAIDFMISYGGTHSERLTDNFGSTRNTYWEYWEISPHNIELSKQSITTSFYSLALAIFRRDCYLDSHVTFAARLSISEFKLHQDLIRPSPGALCSDTIKFISKC